MTVFSKLSIVIPVGPNDLAWCQLLRELVILGKEPEIILSACQAKPAGIELPLNAQWLQSKQGRAHQQNAGARQASHRMNWFLHADTQLTMGVIFAMQQYIESGERNLGYFKLKFAGDGPKQILLNTWAANIRSRYFGLPFGDQGFIINKAIFEQLQGFDEAIPQGEDLDFIVCLKATGVSLQELSAELITSARRYRQHGWLLTTIRHLWLTCHLLSRPRRHLTIVR